MSSDSAQQPRFKFGGAQKQVTSPSDSNPAKCSESEKQMKIKLGTLKRNLKDLTYAQNEVAKEEARMSQVIAADPEKENQQKNVIAEARKMIPDAQNRIRKSIVALQELLTSIRDGEHVAEGSSLAQQIVEADDLLVTAEKELEEKWVWVNFYW